MNIYKDINNFIECPHCKAQYLPSEIFLPNAVLGKPSNIIKSANGIIEYWDGEDIDLEEEYTCDYCNTTFKIKADLTFKTTVDDINNFSEEYSTQIYKDRIILEEPNNVVKEDLFNK